MGAHALDTVRRALRGPTVWVLAGIGLLAGWGGSGLALLALGEGHAQVPGIVGETSHAFAVLATLLVLAGALEEDRRSARFTLALDCTAPGPAGRLLGRWAGAAVLGLALGAFLQVALGLTLGLDPQPGVWLRLYYTTIVVVLLAAGWGLLLSAAFAGGGVVLAGLLAWFLGHLPWGEAGALEGPAGRAVAALLPGPRPPAAAVSAFAAAAGLLLLALALRARPAPRV